jgi:hypothetical protein
VFRRAVHVVVATALSAGCHQTLPPAYVEAVAPPIDTSRPAPDGTARLVIDVVNGPTPVEQQHMVPQPHSKDGSRIGYELVAEASPLCTTPCVVDVPPGNLLLRFPQLGTDDYEVDLVRVGPDPSVYRRSLSVYNEDSSTFGILATSIGALPLVAGTALLPIGLARDSNGMTVAGGINLGVGVVVMTLGILALRRHPTTFQPGASNHFSLGTR